MLYRRLLLFCFIFGLLLPLSSTYPPIAAQGASAPLAFAVPQFEQVWARTDLPVSLHQATRSWVWGPGPGETRQEPFVGAPGGTRTVQYFDKARMEVNPAADPGSQWSTTTGLLVVEMVSGRVQTGPNSYETRPSADVPVAGDASGRSGAGTAPMYSSFRGLASLPGGLERRVPSAVNERVVATLDRAGDVGALPPAGTSDVYYTAYAQETGHNIPDVFARFMESRGSINEAGTLREAALFDPVYVFGYPISEAYWATAPIDGKPQRVLVQLYQRRVLTYIPGFSSEWQVQMGNVGLHYYGWRYPLTPPPPPTPTAAPGANDAFLHVSGNRFYYGGQPVLLKGTNYWLHTHPSIGTWTNWDGPSVREELARARHLGVNSVRIGIPYTHNKSLETVWGKGCSEDKPCDRINGPIANRMTQLLQIAAGYDMKVLFTLFEWSDHFPEPGTEEYGKQLNYLQGVVKPFAEDDRVLGWDLHNEPDNYGTWTHPDGPLKVITWVENISKEMRLIDPRHPLTVGVGKHDTLWAEAGGPGGKRLLDLVDFVSFHSYDVGGLRTQIDAVEARTKKPILLEEMGWPTGPYVLSKPKTRYDEPTQQFLYKTMLGDLKASSLVGVMQWTLQDNILGTIKGTGNPTIESHFGLVRLDGSFKPAALHFLEDYRVPPLPSRTRTDLPLTTPSNPGEPSAP